MTLPFKNDTSPILKKLALYSFKTGKIKSPLIILTIVLSVSLLSTFVLSIMGMHVAEKKQLESSSHVTYIDVDQAQVEKLRHDERISDTLLIKQAYSTDVDQFTIVPMYVEQKTSPISAMTLVEGHYPEKYDEIAVDKAYMKQIGQTPELNTQITVTFYNGVAETYTVTGFTNEGTSEKIYALYYSRDYAESGSQFQHAVTSLATQLKNVDHMSKDIFEAYSRKIGTEAHIAYKNMNINTAFSKSLYLYNEETLIILITGLFVLFVSYLVIYSIFYIYIQNQVHYFGQLRAIGATARQIKRIIKIEGLIFCFVGTSIGLIIGASIAFLYKPSGWTLVNTLICSTIIFIFTYITVLLSLWKPAKIASRTAPIEAIKATADKDIHISAPKRLHHKLTPLSLAKMGIYRNRKKVMITLLSLSVSGIMFMSGTTLLASLDMEKFARHGMMKYGEFIISLSRNAKKDNEHGYTGLQLQNPLNSELIHEISKIEGIKSIKSYESLAILYDYQSHQAHNTLTPFKPKQAALLNQYALNGTIDYEQMIAQDEILVARNKSTEFIYGWRFNVGDQITFKWYDGKSDQSKTFKISNEISDTLFQNPVSDEIFGTVGDFIIPEATLKKMMPSGFNFNNRVVVSIQNYADDEVQIRSQIKALVTPNTYLALDTLYNYYEESYVMYHRTSAVIFGICGFTLLFALINLVNTLIATTLSRKHEFSTLHSIGLSRRQLLRTLQYEGLILAFWHILLTLCLGTPVGYYLITYLKSPWVWRFPTLYFIGYSLLAISFPVIISTTIVYILNKKTLVEQLREYSI